MKILNTKITAVLFFLTALSLPGMLQGEPTYVLEHPDGTRFAFDQRTFRLSQTYTDMIEDDMSECAGPDENEDHEVAIPFGYPAPAPSNLLRIFVEVWRKLPELYRDSSISSPHLDEELRDDPSSNPATQALCQAWLQTIQENGTMYNIDFRPLVFDLLKIANYLAIPEIMHAAAQVVAQHLSSFTDAGGTLQLDVTPDLINFIRNHFSAETPVTTYLRSKKRACEKNLIYTFEYHWIILGSMIWHLNYRLLNSSLESNVREEMARQCQDQYRELLRNPKKNVIIFKITNPPATCSNNYVIICQDRPQSIPSLAVRCALCFCNQEECDNIEGNKKSITLAGQVHFENRSYHLHCNSINLSQHDTFLLIPYIANKNFIIKIINTKSLHEVATISGASVISANRSFFEMDEENLELTNHAEGSQNLHCQRYDLKPMKKQIFDSYSLDEKTMLVSIQRDLQAKKGHPARFYPLLTSLEKPVQERLRLDLTRQREQKIMEVTDTLQSSLQSLEEELELNVHTTIHLTDPLCYLENYIVRLNTIMENILQSEQQEILSHANIPALLNPLIKIKTLIEREMGMLRALSSCPIPPFNEEQKKYFIERLLPLWIDCFELYNVVEKALASPKRTDQKDLPRPRKRKH